MNMTERSRRAFLKSTLAGGALTTGAVLLPSGSAWAATAPQTRATTYRLRVTNNSGSFEQFAVYQNDPDLGVPNAMSLAWLVYGAPPSSTVVFQWTLDYSFMLFAEGGAEPTQILAADPTGPAGQQVQLSHGEGGYLLQPGRAVADPRSGSLYIRELADLPVGGPARVGIGLSGRPVYSAPVEPDTDLVLTPHPGGNYWVTAGTFEAGSVLDVEQIVPPARVTFVPGVYAMQAILDRDDTWRVQPDFAG